MGDGRQYFESHHISHSPVLTRQETYGPLSPLLVANILSKLSCRLCIAEGQIVDGRWEQGERALQCERIQNSQDEAVFLPS